MRILILHPPLGALYGTEYVALELAAAWREAGHDVTLAGHAAAPIEEMPSTPSEGMLASRAVGLLPLSSDAMLSSPAAGMFSNPGEQSPQPPIDGARLPIDGALLPIDGPLLPIDGARSPIDGARSPIDGARLPIDAAPPLTVCVRSPIAGVRRIRLPPLTEGPWAAFHMRSAEAPGLAEALREVRPDRVLVVGLGPRSVNLRHIEIVAEHGVPIALWHHVAGITCQQHGLRYQDRTPCDGRVAAIRCARCRLTAAGVPAPIAAIAGLAGLARLGTGTGAGAGRPSRPSRDDRPGRDDHDDHLDRDERDDRAGSYDRAGSPDRRWRNGLAHLLAGRSLSAAFARHVAALATTVGRVFVGAEWVREVMLINGFAPDRVTLVRPGVRGDLAAALAAMPPAETAADGTLRLLAWSRLDDTKGLDTAIDAVRSRPRLDVRLDIAGDFDPAAPYHAHLRRRAADDARIRFAGRLETADLARTLGAADVALLPSSVRETGPLTVFEARAARLPILGTAIGGIAELCAADASARLFGRGDAAALAALIAELAEDRGELARRRALVPPARTMREAAAECIAEMAPTSMTGGKQPASDELTVVAGR